MEDNRIIEIEDWKIIFITKKKKYQYLFKNNNNNNI